MDIDKIVDKILVELGVSCTETIGGRSPLLCVDVVYSLIIEDTIKDAAILLEVSENSLEQSLRRYFKNRCKKDSRTKWSIFLLGSIGQCKCLKCGVIKPYADFSLCKGRHNDINNLCKECDKYKSSLYRETHLQDCRDKCKLHYLNNKADYLARNAHRKAYKLKATPIWANLEHIKDIYRRCPVGYHVDHIIPLQGELVSGLHVENNLQYLTAIDNLKKHNKFTGE